MPKNLVFNFGYFGINIIIGLLLVPYFIDTLGVAGYALIPLATSMTSYVNLVILSLNSSVSRYLTIDLQKEDYNTANKTFNTALFGTLGLVLLMLPVALIISYYAPEFFEISSEQKQDATLLFIGVICAFLLRAWSSNFGVSLFAYNRLDLQKTIDSINLITQVILIITLFTIFSPKLSYIGFSYLLGALIASIITIYFSRKVNPHLKIRFKDFELSQLKKITDTGGWITITQIGTLFYLQIDLIVVNRLFDTVAGGEYSIVLMWSILLRGVAGLFAGVLTPVVLSYYAKDKFEEIISMSKSSVKFMGLTMALPIGIVCGFAPIILSIWVGPEFIKLWPLMLVLLLHLVINLSVLPLFSINVAYNKVKIPGLVTLFMGIGNLLLAIALPLITNWGYYGVAIAGAIMLTAKNALFTPLYTAKIMDISRNTFTGSMLLGITLAIIVTGISRIIYTYLDISSIVPLVISCALISIIYFGFSWTTCLNKKERSILVSFIPLKIRRQLKIAQYS
ncbi:oligosaccharide flippase family protein [Methanolobus halotolerans]|uniref:oligosaccharide flippase family protein n=1 Tax=Methanolobus halotolerans TaxID=2052935 RepID=UPI001F2F412F|nr:oligosaccharide flippase family protein [Methanolobus halotolerans]